MNRVAAKIAQEVAMFFQHDDVDAGAREKIAAHHAGRAAAHDANAGARFVLSLARLLPSDSMASTLRLDLRRKSLCSGSGARR